MTTDSVSKEIEDYVRKVKKVLPDSFEAEDMIEEIRSHIIESLEDKRKSNPKTSPELLLKEVLSDLGAPEDIAKEWGEIKIEEEDSDVESRPLLRPVLQFVITTLIVIAASWFISSLPDAIVDFWTAFVVLMIFVIAEALLRNWQRSEVKRIDADIGRRY